MWEIFLNDFTKWLELAVWLSSDSFFHLLEYSILKFLSFYNFSIYFLKFENDSDHMAVIRLTLMFSVIDF